MIDDASVSQWLTSVSQTLKDQIIPGLHDDYLEEQGVAAYVLTRMAQRYLSDLGGASPRERETSKIMLDGAASAAASLPSDWSPETRALVGDAQLGEPVVRPASAATAVVSAVVEELWAARDQMSSDDFRTARAMLHSSWRLVLDRDAVLYGKENKVRVDGDTASGN